METDRTNKDVLLKGVKLLGIALACMFTGPILAYISQTKLKTITKIPTYISIVLLIKATQNSKMKK